MRRRRSESLAQRLAVLGSTIRDRRAVLGMSQESLAHAAALHRTYIGSVERGERNLSIGNVFALADALGTSASELLAESEGRAPLDV